MVENGELDKVSDKPDEEEPRRRDPVGENTHEEVSQEGEAFVEGKTMLPRGPEGRPEGNPGKKPTEKNQIDTDAKERAKAGSNILDDIGGGQNIRRNDTLAVPISFEEHAQQTASKEEIPSVPGSSTTQADATENTSISTNGQSEGYPTTDGSATHAPDLITAPVTDVPAATTTATVTNTFNDTSAATNISDKASAVKAGNSTTKKKPSPTYRDTTKNDSVREGTKNVTEGERKKDGESDEDDLANDIARKKHGESDEEDAGYESIDCPKSFEFDGKDLALRNFLMEQKTRYEADRAENSTARIKYIILGHTRADLDSISSALALAYTGGKMYLPVVNTGEDVFRAVKFQERCFLEYLGVLPKHLVFEREAGVLSNLKGRKVFLVDHNTVDPRQRGILLAPKTTLIGVMDHHRMEKDNPIQGRIQPTHIGKGLGRILRNGYRRLQGPKCETRGVERPGIVLCPPMPVEHRSDEERNKEVQTVGSSATIIGDYLLGEDPLRDKVLSRLLYGPIAADNEDNWYGLEEDQKARNMKPGPQLVTQLRRFIKNKLGGPRDTKVFANKVRPGYVVEVPKPDGSTQNVNPPGLPSVKKIRALKGNWELLRTASMKMNLQSNFELFEYQGGGAGTDGTPYFFGYSRFPVGNTEVRELMTDLLPQEIEDHAEATKVDVVVIFTDPDDLAQGDHKGAKHVYFYFTKRLRNLPRFNPAAFYDDLHLGLTDSKGYSKDERRLVDDLSFRPVGFKITHPWGRLRDEKNRQVGWVYKQGNPEGSFEKQELLIRTAIEKHWPKRTRTADGRAAFYGAEDEEIGDDDDDTETRVEGDSSGIKKRKKEDIKKETQAKTDPKTGAPRAAQEGNNEKKEDTTASPKTPPFETSQNSSTVRSSF